MMRSVSRTLRIAITLLAGLAANAPVAAQQSPEGAAPTAAIAEHRAYPTFSLPREVVLATVGGSTLAWGLLADQDAVSVPPSGFDLSEVRWGLDRDVVGRTDVSAKDASDLTQAAAVGLPLVLVWATADSRGRWRVLAGRSTVYVETLLLVSGLTTFGKVLWDRPRPFAYVPVGALPNDESYDRTRPRTLHSMPSGHASTAWAGTAFAVTDHLLARPDAGSWERFGIGFAGGVLAGSTSALRVEAGQHFPSDVIAGSALGAATGVFVPLLHRGDAPLPELGAWLSSMGGVLGGALLGIWLGS